jgi:hypothetical protein
MAFASNVVTACCPLDTTCRCFSLSGNLEVDVIALGSVIDLCGAAAASPLDGSIAGGGSDGVAGDEEGRGVAESAGPGDRELAPLFGLAPSAP